jgi:tetratricopeptide (TPR) repeat protein
MRTRFPARRRPSWFTLALASAVVGIILWETWSLASSLFRRGPLAYEVFMARTPEPVEPAADETAVRRTLGDVAAAAGRGDVEGFAARFHSTRAMAQVAAGGGLQLSSRAQETELGDAIARGILRTFVAPKDPSDRWRAIELLRIRFIAERGEAEILARVTRASATPKFRFWLVKDQGEWKLFDFEWIEEGMRLSRVAGSVLDELLDREIGEATARFRAARDRVRKASARIQRKDFEGAASDLRSIRSSEPPGALLTQIDLLECAALFALGRFVEALAAADRALSRDKDLPLMHRLRAQALFPLKRFPECIAAAEEYVKAAGDDPIAYFLMGNAHELQRRPLEAAAAYRKGMACEEEAFANRHHLALLELQRGDAAEGARLLRESFERMPQPAEHLESAAAALEAVADYATLLEVARLAGKTDPPPADALVLQGAALRKLGRAAEAEGPLVAVRERDPKHARAQRELAYVLSDLGRHDQAGRLVEACRPEDGKEGEAIRLQAHVHARAGRLAEAAPLLRRLLEQRPSLRAELARDPAFADYLSSPEGRALLDEARPKEK